MSSTLFVSDTASLEALTLKLQHEPVFALDTEFIRERTYYPQLCLVQIATPELVACIDPLAIADLAALDALLFHPAPIKIVHAVRQDLEALLTRLKNPPARLFDTQVAAALVGLPPQIGYAELAQRYLGVALDKTHARTDWSARPLAAAQLSYAADDVRYLLPLCEALKGELERLGRLSWFEEEMVRHSAAGTRPVDPEEAWQRLKGLEGLDARRLAIAKALARWREERAMRRNRPRGWILSDDALYAMVRALPADRAALERIGLVPRALIEKEAANLIMLVQSTAAIDDSRPLPRGRPDLQQQKRLKHLSTTVRGVAERLKLSPEILATRRDLQQLLAGNTDVEPLRGWRREIIGAALLQEL